MSTVMNVQIIRPRQGWTDLVSALLILALKGWIVMLILGTITPWHLGYWHSILACIGVGILFKDSNYFYWTKRAAK